MESDDNKLPEITVINLGEPLTDYSNHDPYAAPDLSGTDTITLSGTSVDWGLDSSMATTYSISNVNAGHTISIGAAGASGSLLTSSGANGTSWSNGNVTSASVFSTDFGNASVHLSGDNPRLVTDQSEINLNDLAKVMDVVKDIVDLNQIEIFDKAFRDRHEILQRSWEDIKTAYENYRITEALLRSTPPGDPDDQ